MAEEPTELSSQPQELTVESRAHGWRLDYYLTRLYPNYSRALFQRAIERGVLYVPGAYCYAAEGVEACMHTMRLSFGVPSEGAIVEGISALGQAVRDVWQDAT